MLRPLKIYSTTISCSKLFTEEMPFTFHFATFQSLRAEKPELLAQSFTQGSIPIIKGCTTFAVDPVIMAVVEILHKQTTSFGEQNVWQIKDGENEIIMYVCQSFPYLAGLKIRLDSSRFWFRGVFLVAINRSKLWYANIGAYCYPHASRSSVLRIKKSGTISVLYSTITGSTWNCQL